MSFLRFAWISLSKKNPHNNDKNVEKKVLYTLNYENGTKRGIPVQFFFLFFFLKLIEEAQEGRVPERPEERKREIGGLRKDHVITWPIETLSLEIERQPSMLNVGNFQISDISL